MATSQRAMHAIRRHLGSVTTSSSAVLRNRATVPTSTVTPRRGIASTSAIAYPRQPLRRRTVEQLDVPLPRVEDSIDAEESELVVAAPEAVQARRAVDGATEDTPWYLREQEAYEEEDDAAGAMGRQVFDVRLMDPDVELPEVLQGLHVLLTEGPPSALVARPDDGALSSDTDRRPLHYIHARQRDPQSWSEWIVVVQVRSSAGSAVSRMAKEIGSYLRDKRPPTSEADMDAPAAKPAVNLNTKATSKAWLPFKILSRDAQDGIRLLHASDPERWSRKALAATFKMSVESVRRILASRWQPPPSVVQRQMRRAHERQEERKAASHSREDDDIAQIKASIAKSNGEEQANDGFDDFAEYDDYRVVDDKGNVADEAKPHKQRITYEGLVGVSADGKSHDTANSARGAKSAAGRGDGQWCLVDAGWCVVHVMTAKARNTYDVESQWKAGVQRDVDEQGQRMERDRRTLERQREVKEARFFGRR